MADTSLATTQPKQIERAETFAPNSLTEAFQFADMVLTSGMAPKSYLELISKTENGSEVARAAVVVALQFGMEVGFQPMQSFGPNESNRFGLGHFSGIRLRWGFDRYRGLYVYEIADFLAQRRKIARDAPRNLLAIDG